MRAAANSSLWAWALSLALAACSGGGGSSPAGGGGNPPPETVSLVRDTFGTPHVFAATDAGAYFGAGYAAAEDRLFQMCWTRLMVQGRVAEFFGAGAITGPGGSTLEKHVVHDIEARLIGWHAHAQRAADGIDPAMRELLDAYAAGVNRYMQLPAAGTHPFFAQLGIPLEPWTAADCIGVWLRFGRHFGSDGLKEAQLRKEWELLLADPQLTPEQRLDLLLGPRLCDDEAATVQQSDVPAATVAALIAYALQNGLPSNDPNCTPALDGPKFSQAWAVSGARTTTGRAALVGDPRIDLSVPGALYEWSMQGASFSVRGAGVAGSPNLISGSSASLAWSPTASGLDQADLFKLLTDPQSHPGQYLLDGVWTDFSDLSNQLVLVKGSTPRPLASSSSVFGPVVSASVKGAQPGEHYALRRVPLDDPTRDSSSAFVALYRAANLDSGFAALAEWRFPSANLIFADAGGRIGYALVGDIPMRNPALELAGVIAQDGSSLSSDWREMLPHALRPHVLDPASGQLLSANQRPVGSWFPVPILLGSFSGGDTFRALRLRELFAQAAPQVHPQAVFDMHHDIVQPVRRDIARLGAWLRDNGFNAGLSARSQSALALLDPWLQSGAPMDGLTPGSVLAAQFEIGFRPDLVGDVLVARYGGGENGLLLMSKTLIAGIQASPALVPGIEEQLWVDDVLADAWSVLSGLGPPASWPAWYRNAALDVDLPLWQSLEGFESLLPGAAVPAGLMRSVDAGTLLSPLGMVYTQLVSPGDGDGARSALPVGASEANGPHQLDQLPLWIGEQFKPSPRTLPGVAAMGPSTLTELEYRR